jgi:hypothetical protein
MWPYRLAIRNHRAGAPAKQGRDYWKRHASLHQTSAGGMPQIVKAALHVRTILFRFPRLLEAADRLMSGPDPAGRHRRVHNVRPGTQSAQVFGR